VIRGFLALTGLGLTVFVGFGLWTWFLAGKSLEMADQWSSVLSSFAALCGLVVSIAGLLMALPRAGSEVKRFERESLLKVQELLDQHVPIVYELLNNASTDVFEDHPVVKLTRDITALAHRIVNSDVHKNVLKYAEGSLRAVAVRPNERIEDSYRTEMSALVGELFNRAYESVSNAIRTISSTTN
jgi:hypothetical protein